MYYRSYKSLITQNYLKQNRIVNIFTNMEMIYEKVILKQEQQKKNQRDIK